MENLTSIIPYVGAAVGSGLLSAWIRGKNKQKIIQDHYKQKAKSKKDLKALNGGFSDLVAIHRKQDAEKGITNRQYRQIIIPWEYWLQKGGMERFDKDLQKKRKETGYQYIVRGDQDQDGAQIIRIPEKTYEKNKSDIDRKINQAFLHDIKDLPQQQKSNISHPIVVTY